ncbi:MAG: amidohydrolase family protein [Limisphaerales bacterium]
MRAPINHQPSTINHQLLIRARMVLPISQPPIENGAVLISGNRITAIGAWKNFTHHQAIDLGEVILLPGLINTHCHLDYTDMAGQLPPPKTFTDWIPAIMAAKSAWSFSDFARSWLNGAQMLLQTGTTTVADIEAVPDLLPDVWNATPLRVFSFLEMTGIRAQRKPDEILRDAISKIDSLDSLSHSRSRASLSPHAPYSTLPELLRLSANVAREKKLRVTTHVAESAQEFETFAHARGKMFDWLARNERDNSDCGLGTPVQHLERAGILSENFLAVHANYLGENDAALLAKRNVSVVHCPRSHFYFRHEPFPLRQLLNVKVNVCLGTDSLASVRKTGNQKLELNLFGEMRAFSEMNPKISAKQILQMATVNGARALGLAGRVGELSENAFADLISIPFAGKISKTNEAAVNFSEHVGVSMIDGQWAIPPK